MRFVETRRFSPVIFGGDLPHADDLFHIDESEIPRKKEDRVKFIKDNHIFKDTAWWSKQYQRCMHVFSIKRLLDTDPVGGMFGHFYR